MGKENEIISTSYTPEELYSVMYRAEQGGAYVAHIRGELCSTTDSFFREISSAMRFPHYFGWNWAAFDECITDLEWLKFSSLLIVIDNHESLFVDDNSPNMSVKLLIKYLTMTAEYWKSQNVPISVYLNHQLKSKH